MTKAEIISVIINACLIPILAWAVNELTSFLKNKANNEKLNKYFDLANDAVITAVNEIMQTFVSTLKKEGKWTAETAKQALEMAKLKAQEIMGAAALKALPDIVGDVEAWLTSKIEAATLEAKNLITTPCASAPVVSGYVYVDSTGMPPPEPATTVCSSAEYRSNNNG